MCYSKDEKKKTSIEIHQADCMCEATNKQHVTSSTYTPLDVLNEVENKNQSNSNNEYLDVVWSHYIYRSIKTIAEYA